MFSLLSLGIALASLKTGLAAVYDDPSQLSTDKQYDFVVVGAGTAGNVIAARLAENANTSVLVIEAGRNNVGYDSDLITIPFLGPQASPHTTFDWNYTTVPQEPLNNQLIAYPRGYVLGGSSSTNYMVYTRGSSDDYDRFAELAGDDGWNWDNLFPYALKNERHVPPNDGHNETGQYIPSIHGTNGPLETSLYGYAADIDNRVIATTSELSEEFPWNPDYNSGNMLGVSWMHSTIGGPLRSSSATAYLVPALSNYSNLDLVYNSQVTRLIQNGEIDGLPVFTTVEFAKNPTAPRYNVSATREVILSAGAIGTPQILMLSGIGRSLDLAAVGINPIVDLPEVGQNLVDHPLLPIQWNANSNETLDPLGRGGAAFDAALEQYHANGTGRLAANGVSNHMAFYRLPENSSVLAEFEDPTSGPGAPHYEHAFANGFFTTSQTQPTSGSYFSIINIVVTPTSRGAITLASNDPFQHPTIDPKLLTSDYDVSVMIESVKAAQRFCCGTCLGWLLLKKAKGVRIVDASVFPIIPAGHPLAMIYIVAERAADVIKTTWGM
ncbi:aryl-alcohol-oxidase from pleurotus Eryingii [Desarmillaria tabescens]|uniref:Aryl-alcohol-oxidase from pleurotus Eryingii n=1 Tax=Armillaria tabescens TaxID=1929756 RepID=A0AA39T463_ARMTA|nr:aryl-alcohol-oxidase from pleurotus Eryingii [Desarmillaria tabescens]KAK0463271.1 aryl-alcohol-oxidase from pleurotus Eryingii [Desarmillaria tabescens]